MARYRSGVREEEEGRRCEQRPRYPKVLDHTGVSADGLMLLGGRRSEVMSSEYDDDLGTKVPTECTQASTQASIAPRHGLSWQAPPGGGWWVVGGERQA